MAKRRGRPKQARNLDAIAFIRVTGVEKHELSEQARDAGMTLSAYARRRMLGHPVVASTDAAVIRELRRLGGLLKMVHTDSGGAYSSQTAAALASVRQAIERLAR